MESPVAHKLLKQIAAFSTDVDNLAREVHTLRKTGNPQHLPTIKDVTQRLITQLLAFSAQLTGAKGATPQHQHVVALIRDSEYSSLHFLAYLHNLVAHTRTIISHTSHQDITVNFDWKYIQDLLNKLRKLSGSLNTRTHRAQCKIPESASSSPYSLTATRDRGQMCGYVPQVESRSHTQSPWSRTADFKVELHDSPGTHALDCKDVTHHHFQPSSSHQQEYHDCTIHKIKSDLGLKPAQIFELYRVWSTLFCLPAMPALVLYYALFPSDIALGAPVSRLEGNSLERLIEALEQHMAHYTGGLFQINMPGQGETDSTQRLHNTGRDALVVRPVDEAVAAFLDSRHHQDAIQGLANAQGFDALKQLASAFLMIMKTADPYKSDTVQRHLMYLAHTLRYATHLPDHEVQLYLDAIANTMSYHQAAVPNRQLPWYIAPQPLQSLHLKPELRIFSDIRTFAAKEGLRRPPHQDPPVDEPRRRFAITANALSSWSSCMRPCHPLKLFEPCLERKKAVMTYLLINLTPPESIVCGYSLWTEAVRLCNTGTVAEPAELLAIFLAASERPDLLWNQILGPAAGMGSRSERILNVLRDKIGDAVAPDLLVYLITQIEQRHAVNGHY